MKENKEVVYVAGPYTAPTLSELRSNIERARMAGAWLILKDKAPVIPHSNLDGVERYVCMGWEDYTKASLPLLEKCDSVYMLSGWEKSREAKMEHRLACRLGKKIYYQDRDAEFLILKNLFFGLDCQTHCREGGKNVPTDADLSSQI